MINHNSKNRLAKILTGLGVLLRNKRFLAGLLMMVAIYLMTIIGPLVIPYDPTRIEAGPLSSPPSWEHILGTDDMGRDIAAQMLVGTRLSFHIGLLAGVFTLVLSVMLGFISGYYRGSIDTIIASVTDVFLVIPALPVLVLISSYLRTITIPVMAAILTAFNWAWPTKAFRSQVLTLRKREFVDMAKLSGLSSINIIIRELIPNMLAYIGASFAIAFTGAMITEIGLEILGLGPQNVITLGIIIYRAIRPPSAILLGQWWMWLPPVIVVILLFSALFLLHLGLDEVANPRLRTK